MSVSPLKAPDDGIPADAIERVAQAAERGLADEARDTQAKLTCERSKVEELPPAPDAGLESRRAELDSFVVRHQEWRKSGTLIFAGGLLLAVMFLPVNAESITLLIPVLALVALLLRICLR